MSWTRGGDAQARLYCRRTKQDKAVLTIGPTITGRRWGCSSPLETLWCDHQHISIWHGPVA